MSTRLNRQLDRAVDHLLDRGRYERRGGAPYGREQIGACLLDAIWFTELWVLGR